MPVIEYSGSEEGICSYLTRMLTAISCLFFLSVINAFAGITLDGSLGTKGALTGPNYSIPASVGQQAGNNLFHSFGIFNITSAESATFSGPAGIQNIISRVTGGQSSSIDGAISSTINGASLYFINPAGIVFGPNATLNVSGSFHASTADYIRLSDGGRFDASTPSNSLLTSAPPSAFGFLSNSPKGISVNGSFLQVPEGKTISLVGGDLSISTGNLYAPGGTINLISVASAGEATFSGNNFNTDTFSAMGQISISDTRVTSDLPVDGSGNTIGNIDTSGTGGGQVYIRGGHFVMDNALVYAQTYGSTDGKGIDINVRDEIDIANNAVISGMTYSDGNGGSISLTTPTLNLDSFSRMTASTRDTGDGGSISINVDNLSIKGGSDILSNAYGAGKGGSVTVNATSSVDISGKDTNGSSGLFSTASSSGAAGLITVTNPLLNLSGNGQINVSTSGSGAGGDIGVNVTQMNLDSGSSIASESTGTGVAGSIVIKAGDTIKITDSSITTATADADSGNISIDPQLMDIRNSSITATVHGGTGNGGNIMLNLGDVVLEGSRIIANAEMGNGGSIDIKSNVFIRSSDSTVSASSAFGLQGTVAISAPLVDLSGNLAV